ncbi:MAG: tRNA adenosine(34) deaminase TadA [Actinobacteria bacterium]|nr:tRNA adenosine(34) deaminase TadA [Actinomycetota bacterium]
MDDEVFMRVALDEAERAAKHGDVPVGAALVRDGDVIARACNEKEARRDPTAHAEILCLRAGAEAVGDWRLVGSTLYVTLEPCPMCAGALVGARVGEVVYGPQDPLAGAAYSLYNIVQDPRLNHSVSIRTGVLAEESARLLRSFFSDRR